MLRFWEELEQGQYLLRQSCWAQRKRLLLQAAQSAGAWPAARQFLVKPVDQQLSSQAQARPCMQARHSHCCPHPAIWLLYGPACLRKRVRRRTTAGAWQGLFNSWRLLRTWLCPALMSELDRGTMDSADPQQLHFQGSKAGSVVCTRLACIGQENACILSDQPLGQGVKLVADGFWLISKHPAAHAYL